MPFLDDFELCRGNYENFGASLEVLIQKISEEKGVDIFRIERRIKEIESIKEKLNRSDKVGKYNTLNDMSDICGLRVVLFDMDSCRRLVDGIREQFNIDELRSVDKFLDLDDDQFGYISTHLIVKLTDQRAELFEYKSYSELVAEIQVRTVLQHAWAALDHKLRYKTAIEAPKEVRRKLYRISALLEAADEAFLEIKRSTEELVPEYTANMELGNLNIPINRDSLEVFIVNSDVSLKFIEKIKYKGVRYAELTRDSDGPWDYLIRTLGVSGIDNIDKLSIAMNNVNDKNINDVYNVFIKSKLGAMGIFSAIRLVVLSDSNDFIRRKIIYQVSSDSKLSKAEKDYFLQNKKE